VALVLIALWSPVASADEPALMVDVGGPLEFTVGRQHGVKVTPTVTGATVELIAAPKGMTLEAGALTWTAGDAAVGVHPVTLRLSAKGATRTQSLWVRARRPSLTLPFTPAIYADPADPGLQIGHTRLPGHVSADGSAAVFLGRDETGRNPPVNRVVVADLDKLAVEAERQLLVELTTAAVDGRHVYVGLTESEAIKVLVRKDLSEKGVLHIAGRPADIVTGGDLLLVTSWKQNRPDPRRTEGFDAIALKPKPFDTIQAKGAPVPIRRGSVAAPPVPVGGGWWYGGTVYDAKFEKVRAIIGPQGFWAWSPKAKSLLTDPPVDSPLWSPTHGEGRWYTPWGVSLRDSQLLAGGERVGYVPTSAAPPAQSRNRAITIVLPDHPAAACLTLSQKPGRDKLPVVRAEVTFYNLTAAEAGATLVLSEQPADPNPHAPPLDYTPLGLASRPGGRLVAVVGREVYTITVPDLDPEKFPWPFHVPPDFPVTVVSGEEVSVRLPATDGGKPPITFALVDEVTGVRIDERTGTLVIEPRKLVPELADRLAGASKLTNYLTEVDPRFEKLTGKQPTGIPVWVPVSLIARDKLLGKAVVEFGFFVDVPIQHLGKAGRDLIATNPTIRIDPRGQIPIADRVLPRTGLTCAGTANPGIASHSLAVLTTESMTR
jgi:hypothetical protein